MKTATNTTLKTTGIILLCLITYSLVFASSQEGTDVQELTETQNSPETKEKDETVNNNPNYDAALAEKLEADDYGMKSYVLVMLKTGDVKPEETAAGKAAYAEAFKGHFENMGRMVAAEQLVVAGPFGKNEQGYRGLFILNVKTVDEANDILKTDPAFKAGYLGADIIPWYGSAALPEYLPASDKIWKVKP